ncbi:MAG: 16S rRNA (guanine(966)-N(2))-methyltransferase RsmD [Lachnospiraceae bacterium]|nr:16S rRNA (guanine(966)-N(2))-methyltransferase RsmD [Lachnospiraceae bacterium]
MRVIAGSARRLQLKTIEGMDTRPTTDRIKETLFNILQPEILDSRFLDLFAGSGAIGIEALSRGAEEAVFAEQSRKACDCIRYNLKAARLEDRAQVMECDVLSALKRLESRKASFDLIFMDPPYGMDLEKQALWYLKDSLLSDSHTLIVVEASLKTDFSWLSQWGYCMLKSKEYKTNKHVFIKKINLQAETAGQKETL